MVEAVCVSIGIEIITMFFALILSLVSFRAYRRSGKRRLLLVSFGFLLYFLKEIVLWAWALIFPGFEFLDVISAILEFAMIATFFVAIATKEGKSVESQME
ncbi:hypothetical protein [Thermococcus sp. 21S7]|uniref:hypothetical protein n=1 Tax=Thermococcus sp. 21S7 TaxID=1638221 RepID=UPI00143C50DD|nr:hypothetical protein [Thermococcus sp. 21S7]NJE61211.1 hypothetical protein [Thermococcus sp. 21S7]